MKLSWNWKFCTAIIILIAYSYSAVATSLADDKNGDNLVHKTKAVPTYQLDVSKPIVKILAGLNGLKNLNITLLIQAIAELGQNCIPSQNETLSFLEAHIAQMRSSQQEIFVNAQVSKFISFSDYCKTEDFETLHNFVWKVKDGAGDGGQFIDLMSFVYRFGVPDIFTLFQELYKINGCPEDLRNDIPDEPPAVTGIKSSQKSRSNIRDEIISSQSSDKNKSLQLFQSECNLMEILTNILSSGALNLLQFIETLITQFNTDPSLHFLIGKIQEPIKGTTFREFRKLDATKHLFEALNTALLENANVDVILTLVESLLGLSLREINLVALIASIVEALLWQNFDPLP